MVAVTYKTCGLRVDFVCDGPDQRGQCPRVSTGEIVPCAGRKVALSKDEVAPALLRGRYRVAYRVPTDAVYCPMVEMEPDSLTPLSASGRFVFQ
jgi:hypothetical protein